MDIRQQILKRMEKGKKIADEKLIQYMAKTYRVFAKQAALKFYYSYSPLDYKRTFSLERLFIIDKKQKGVLVKASSAGLFGHRVSGDYILDIVAEQGYHGGAIKGPSDLFGNPHPSPGTPYWRRPATGFDEIPPYSLWGRAAVKTEPPIEIFQKMSSEAMSNGVFGDYWMKEFLKYVINKNIRMKLEIKLPF